MSIELQKQAVDRVLEVLSPVLAAEIERAVAETREALEAEFEQRMQKTVVEATAAARTAAELETQRAIEEVRRQVSEEQQARFDRMLAENNEAVRGQVTEQQREELARTLADANATLRAQFEGELNKVQADWTSERERLQREQLEQWRVCAEAQVMLSDVSSQPEILTRWLKLVEPFTSALALYTAKGDALVLWKHRGTFNFPEMIKSDTTIPESYFRLIIVRGKTVAAVCAIQPYRLEALEFLVVTMEHAIELFGLKLRLPAAKPVSPEAVRIP